MPEVLMRKKERLLQVGRGCQVFWVTGGGRHVAVVDGGIYFMSKVKHCLSDGPEVTQLYIMVRLCNL